MRAEREGFELAGVEAKANRRVPEGDTRIDYNGSERVGLPAEALYEGCAVRFRGFAAMADNLRENRERRLAERVGFEPTVEFPLHTLSKRAPSTTRTSLHFRINDLRAAWNRIAQNLPSRISDSACPVVPIVCKHARRDENRNCVRPSNLARSLTAIWLSRWCDWNVMPGLQLVRAPRHEVRPAERERNCRVHPCS
jgi:hypothetical protein